MMQSQTRENHYPVRLSDEAATRLGKLAQALVTHVPAPNNDHEHFNMGTYCEFFGSEDRDNDSVDNAFTTERILSQTIDPCNTAGCTAGWAAIFHKEIGFVVPTHDKDEFDMDQRPRIDWAEVRYNLVEGDTNLDGWLFDGSWYYADNSPKGAAQRILYAMKYGVPRVNKYESKELYEGEEVETAK